MTSIVLKQLWPSILKKLEQQGVTFLLLLAITIYFQTELRKTQEASRACNDEIIKIYREERGELQELIVELKEGLKKDWKQCP